MEHFSRAADFLYFFRTKFTEQHAGSSSEPGAGPGVLTEEHKKTLDKLALILLLHFEQVRKAAES
jgi:hypothetical protein